MVTDRFIFKSAVLQSDPMIPVNSDTKFTCLMYHSLRDPQRGSYSITPRQFKAQLSWLKAEGFVIEGFSELWLRLQNNEFPSRYVVVSFDDGHNSDLVAAECLREVGAQATFFLCKNLCGSGPGFLEGTDIRELASFSSIGSHGVTHVPLTTMSIESARAELADSKKWLEDVAGVSITTVSLPGGYINGQIISEALKLGYNLCANSVEWWNKPGIVRRTSVVNRVATRGAYSQPTFQRMANGDLRFLLKRRLRSGLLALPKNMLGQSQISRLSRLTRSHQRASTAKG
jgi:peptidoglycan/xylan/chitin deacetylase (PgdA/CDA1 family)